MAALIKDSLESALHGKRVLITGDTGFKGSWLSLWLHELGANVVGYALPPEQEHAHFNLLALDRLIHHVTGDIRDLEAMGVVFRKFEPELVFHLAAQSLVRFSYCDPKSTFDTNVGGSLNLLECVRNTHSIKSIVYVTSDKCYKNREWLWGYRENDELGGHDPYSASKAAAEILFSSYMASFFHSRDGFGGASVRAGNVFGGGDWATDRIFPDCVNSLVKNQPVFLRNPNAVRPWQHVLDPLFGYLRTAIALLGEPKRYSGAWNFGPEGTSIRTVKQLADKIVLCWGEGEVQVCSDMAQQAPHEAHRLNLCCDKAHELLNWHPVWGFDTAVNETVFWYKEMIAGRPVIDLSRLQINRYMGEQHD